MHSLHEIPADKIAERKLCGRIQHFYDILHERKNQIKSSQLHIDEEFDYLIMSFEQIFKDIVYVD